MTMVEFHPQSNQAVVDEQYHINSRNERWMMQLKAIQASGILLY